MTILKNYQCIKCKAIVQKTMQPSSSSCPKGSHNWKDLGEVGINDYQCKKCGIMINLG